jgi:hypothetical protein
VSLENRHSGVPYFPQLCVLVLEVRSMRHSKDTRIFRIQRLLATPSTSYPINPTLCHTIFTHTLSSMYKVTRAVTTTGCGRDGRNKFSNAICTQTHIRHSAIVPLAIECRIVVPSLIPTDVIPNTNILFYFESLYTILGCKVTKSRTPGSTHTFR